MNARIETWFPKSVYVAEDVRKDLLSPLSEEIRSLSVSENTSKNSSLFVQSSHTTNRKLHTTNKLFKTLSHDIMNHVGHYASSLGYCDAFINQCHMADMWYNISGKGDFIFPHSHPGAFFSGAYYVNSSPGNQIKFYDRLDQYVELAHNPNPLSFVNANYDCIPGRLLIFKSDFVHGVPVQEFEGEKIVISFNVLYVNVL
jgi:uncharacterized protein (TIGR02466 family)